MEDYTVDRKKGRICIKQSRLSMSVKVKCDRISCRRLPCYSFLPPSDRRHLEYLHLTLFSLLARPKSSGDFTKKPEKARIEQCTRHKTKKMGIISLIILPEFPYPSSAPKVHLFQVVCCRFRCLASPVFLKAHIHGQTPDSEPISC